jgi:Tfp pilus assembly protein PilE
MENEKRSWPLKEALIVAVVVAILAVVGYAYYLEHKNRAKIAEIPGNFKEIMGRQLSFQADFWVSDGRYASTIGTLGWRTALNLYGNVPQDCSKMKYDSKGKAEKEIILKHNPAGYGLDSGDYRWACGRYFAFGASEKNCCTDETVGVFGVGKALVYAAPITDNPIWDYPFDWQKGACMRVMQEPSTDQIKGYELHHK